MEKKTSKINHPTSDKKYSIIYSSIDLISMQPEASFLVVCVSKRTEIDHRIVKSKNEANFLVVCV